MEHERQHRPNTPEARIAYALRVIEGISPANQPVARRWWTDKRGSGLKSSSLAHCAGSLAALDRFVAGTSLIGIDPTRLTDWLVSMEGEFSPLTIYSHAARAKDFYKWHNKDALPFDVKRALKRRPAFRQKDRLEIPAADFDAMLTAAGTLPFLANRVKTQAILWALWDSGLRNTALRELRIKHFRLDQKGGARIEPPSIPEGLKTLPNPIYVVDCVPAVKAWLSIHPHGADPEATLFPTGRGGPYNAYWCQNLIDLVHRVCKIGGTRAYTPHDFRHTRATRAARNGWVEAEMRRYFWWSPSSKMPSVYIHLAQADMERRVRQDAGIDESGHRQAEGIDDAAVDRILTRKLKKLLLED